MKTKTLMDKILDATEIVAIFCLFATILMSFILILCVFIAIIKC